jgi:hypothetical protein
MIVGSNILAGASGQAGYFLNRSVRLRQSASAYLNRTLTTPTNNKIWTWSAWVKKGKPSGTSTASQTLFATGSGSTDAGSTLIIFDNERIVLTGFNTNWLISTAVYRDPSAWYHILVAWDNSNATVNNRIKIYVNGLEIVYATDNRASLSTSSTYGINQAVLHTIGAWSWNNGSFTQPSYFDGYITEINFIDGQALTPTSFGEFNVLTGVWQPKKYGGTYGTNGFYLNFNDNSAATAAAIGKDNSGNGNNWTPNNISVTAGNTYDSMTDVPTLTSPTTSNYPVMNPLIPSASSFITSGNLNIAGLGVTNQVQSTFAVTSGKWYWEIELTNDGAYAIVGVSSQADLTSPFYPGSGGTSYGYDGLTGNKYNNGSASAYGATYASGNLISVALDMDSGKIWFAKNGVWQASGDPAAGTNAAFTTLSNAVSTVASYGRRSATAANPSGSINFGQRQFVYTPPTGFVALNTYNLPDSTISNGATQFAATIYTGTGAARTITNTTNNPSVLPFSNNPAAIPMQPDFVWIKDRSVASAHALTNSVTGITKYLESNSTGVETTDANSVTALNTNGFNLGAGTAIYFTNRNGEAFVAWQWKASNAAAVTNTAGSVTSSVSANPSAGFSIVSFTNVPVNASTYTIGHGLGVAPKMIILKNMDFVDNWYCYHASLGASARISLNTTASVVTGAGIWGNTAPTSSVFSLVGNAIITVTTQRLIGYCFSEIAGYSKFGNYTGNGSADGTFVYTGFRPRYILMKRTDTTSDWWVHDTSRDPFNVSPDTLYPNGNFAEDTSTLPMDILSNGFKLRTNNATFNGNGGSYIYAAFAENPYKLALAR